MLFRQASQPTLPCRHLLRRDGRHESLQRFVVGHKGPDAPLQRAPTNASPLQERVGGPPVLHQLGDMTPPDALEPIGRFHEGEQRRRFLEPFPRSVRQGHRPMVWEGSDGEKEDEESRVILQPSGGLGCPPGLDGIGTRVIAKSIAATSAVRR